MTVEEFLLVVIQFVVVSGLVVTANIADRDEQSWARNMVLVAIALINVAIVLLYGLQQILIAYEPDLVADGVRPPSEGDAWAAFALSLVIMALTGALFSRKVRQQASRLFPAMRQQTAEHQASGPAKETLLRPDSQGEPLFPQMLGYYTTSTAQQFASQAGSEQDFAPPPVRGTTYLRGYNPDSMVHWVAMCLMVYLVGIQFLNFILGGGLEGVAEALSDGISVLDLVVNSALLIVVPLLGVGWGLRRSGKQVLQRLGLKMPGLEEIGVSFAATFGLFIFLMIVTAVWVGLVSEDTFREETQASDALASGVDTVWMAFLIAFSAAVSEEIAFRGALQPVFGLWPTAIVFALTHSQYTLTPASLIILGVALVFGWLRARYDTTTAMLTHFLYNFFQLLLVVVLPEEAILLLPRWLGLV